MNRLFWLMIGMALGALGYRYFTELANQTPELQSLGDQAKRLTESGRMFAHSGRQLIDDGQALAQTAATVAQSRGRDVLDSLKSQAEKLQGSHIAEAARDAGRRLREEVREDIDQ